MKVGRSARSLTYGFPGNKHRRVRLGCLAVSGCGVVVAGLSRGGAACVSLGLMMQLAGFFCLRRNGWRHGTWPFLAVPVAGLLGWWWPSVLRPVDQLTLYALALCGPLWLFARSLRPGQVPLVTRLAGAVHGTLRADVRRYTVCLTWGWVVFFVLALLAPPVLWACAPRQGWWRFPLHGGAALLALLFFFGELGARRLIIRDYDHASLKQNLMAGRIVFMGGK